MFDYALDFPEAFIDVQSLAMPAYNIQRSAMQAQTKRRKPALWINAAHARSHSWITIKRAKAKALSIHFSQNWNSRISRSKNQYIFLILDQVFNTAIHAYNKYFYWLYTCATFIIAFSAPKDCRMHGDRVSLRVSRNSSIGICRK